MPENFEVISGGDTHDSGNPECKASWCDGHTYPKPCSCGGLIHCEFVDESFDGPILAYKCDRCDNTNDE